MLIFVALVLEFVDVFLVGSIYGVLAKRNWDNKRLKY